MTRYSLSSRHSFYESLEIVCSAVGVTATGLTFRCSQPENASAPEGANVLEVHECQAACRLRSTAHKTQVRRLAVCDAEQETRRVKISHQPYANSAAKYAVHISCKVKRSDLAKPTGCACVTDCARLIE